jgi:5-methyltetrahydropteroyltriglutamate--homocysteine methyltransferase
MPASYRADHVGSLLRPRELLNARSDHAAGILSAEQLKELEDSCILRALELQRGSGIEVLSDGEYRRGCFRTELANAVDGMAPDNVPLSWRGPQGTAVASPPVWVISGPLRARQRITAHESGFLLENASGPCKVTIPSPGFMGSRCYQAGVSDQHYPTVADAVRDLAAIVRDEVVSLIDEGVPYIQLDAPGYTAYVDDVQRERMRANGNDPDLLFSEIVEADNSTIQGLRREGLTIAIHLCRGNNRSHWLSEGSYEIIAERLFNSLDVDAFLLEYDNDRSGGFEPLRFVPRGRTVVLGLITSKDGRLESLDDLRRRIDEASKYVPMEDLAISPQCGFASVDAGNAISWEDQRRKLELVSETARVAWG